MEEDKLIKALQSNLTKLACLGIESLIKGNAPKQVSAPAPVHAPARVYVDPGIRVSGSSEDNINNSYVRDYLAASGCTPSSRVTDTLAKDDERSCVICETNVPVIMFMPCNHFAFCKGCSELLNECPLCRRVVDHKIRVHES
jgi:hypothetical protein